MTNRTTADAAQEAVRAIAEATDGHLGPFGMNCTILYDQHQLAFGFAGGTLGWDINTLAADGDWEHYESVTTTLAPTDANGFAIIARCELAIDDNRQDPKARAAAKEFDLEVRNDFCEEED